MPHFSKKWDFMRLMCFDYCLQIRSDQWNKTPQKQPELCCSHLGPCYRLTPPLCRPQQAASCSAAAVEPGKVPVLPVSNSKGHLWHLPKVCWIKAFFFPVLFTALSKRYCKVWFTHKVQKNLQLAAGNQKSSGLLTLADLLSKQVFCCRLSSNSLHI